MTYIQVLVLCLMDTMHQTGVSLANYYQVLVFAEVATYIHDTWMHSKLFAVTFDGSSASSM